MIFLKLGVFIKTSVAAAIFGGGVPPLPLNVVTCESIPVTCNSINITS